MKNEKAAEHIEAGPGGPPQVPLALPILAAAVVLLSLFLIFSYITDVFDRDSGLEISLQALLTEESAVEALEHALVTGSVSGFTDIPSFELEGQRTVFEVIDVSAAPPEERSWRIPGADILRVLPAGGRLFAISGAQEGLRVYLVSAIDGSSVRELGILPGWSGDGLTAAAAVAFGEPFLFLVREAEGSAEIALVSPEGGMESRMAGAQIRAERSFLSAGYWMESPALVLSEGSNTAFLFVFDTSDTFRVSSPPGTTPVFRKSGALFGEPGYGYENDGSHRVSSIMEDDFTGDGKRELVFAGPDHISIVLRDGTVHIDTVPGAVLAAWGSAEERGLLSARWSRDGGSDGWRVFMDGRFVDSSGPEFFSRNWEGRIGRSRNGILGSTGGSIVLADPGAGESAELAVGPGAFLCDLDGSGPDVVSYGGDGLRAVLNPLSGGGLLVTLSSLTTGEGGSVLRDGLWRISIHQAGDSKRVRSERAG